jgi:hypothetical protein
MMSEEVLVAHVTIITAFCWMEYGSYKQPDFRKTISMLRLEPVSVRLSVLIPQQEIAMNET